MSKNPFFTNEIEFINIHSKRYSRAKKRKFYKRKEVFKTPIETIKSGNIVIKKKSRKVQEIIEPKNELLKVNPYGTFNLKKFRYNRLFKPSAIISLDFYALSNIERVKRSRITAHLKDFKLEVIFYDFLLPYKINSINPQLSQSILFDLHEDFEELKYLLKIRSNEIIFGGGWMKDKKNHKKYLELVDFVYSK